MAWITDGEAGLSVRTKLNKLMVPLASGSISSPVDFIDLALPSGYSFFRLSLVGIQKDDATGPDNISYRLSDDAGATFHTGASDYRCSWLTLPGDIGASLGKSNESDDQGYIQASNMLDGTNSSPDTGMMAEGIIFPGSATVKAQMQTLASLTLAADQITGNWTLSRLMVTAARQNLIRIAPFFGDEGQITAGDYFLEGRPAP